MGELDEQPVDFMVEIGFGVVDVRTKREIINERQKEWRKNNKNKYKGKYKSYQKEWELRNKEKVLLSREKHREKRNAAHRLDTKNNTEKAIKKREYANKKYYRHKNRILAQQKKYYEKNAINKITYAKIYHLKTKYNLTYEKLSELENHQNGLCAICGGKNKSKLTNRLFVDHCHNTNKIRGLLCHHCNTGIGAFKDNIDLMLKAVNYIKIHENKE